MRITKGFKQLIALSVILGELSVILGLIMLLYEYITWWRHCCTIGINAHTNDDYSEVKN